MEVFLHEMWSVGFVYNHIYQVNYTDYLRKMQSI